jgi:hypothetical protein
MLADLDLLLTSVFCTAEDLLPEQGRTTRSYCWTARRSSAAARSKPPIAVNSRTPAATAAILAPADHKEREVALRLLPLDLRGGELIIADNGYVSRGAGRGRGRAPRRADPPTQTQTPTRTRPPPRPDPPIHRVDLLGPKGPPRARTPQHPNPPRPPRPNRHQTPRPRHRRLAQPLPRPTQPHLRRPLPLNQPPN